MKNVKGVMAGIILFVLVAISAPIFMQRDVGAKIACPAGLIESAARQDIEYLQRGYAKATDLLGITEGESFNEGREL